MSYERLVSVSGPRWLLIVDLIGDDSTSVLDVGCRDKALSSHLPEHMAYVGLDLVPPADVLADAEEGLPFAARSFDVVVFADVLEHLDDPHAALDEGLRVASRRVVVVLPNTFSWVHRLRYLAGQKSGKYLLGPENQKDRHRWLVGLREAETFVHVRAQRNGWRVTRSWAHDGGFRRRLPRAASRLLQAVAEPQLWAWEYAARLERIGGENAAERVRIKRPAKAVSR
jgi:SAM-dependent methyltransferase